MATIWLTTTTKTAAQATGVGGVRGSRSRGAFTGKSIRLEIIQSKVTNVFLKFLPIILHAPSFDQLSELIFHLSLFKSAADLWLHHILMMAYALDETMKLE